MKTMMRWKKSNRLPSCSRDDGILALKAPRTRKATHDSGREYLEDETNDLVV